MSIDRASVARDECSLAIARVHTSRCARPEAQRSVCGGFSGDRSK
jgi:hypothetical protein